jgi:hypothetical protein
MVQNLDSDNSAQLFLLLFFPSLEIRHYRIEKPQKAF